MLDSPYAGLMPFTEAQAPFFFGRDHEREIIVANLLAAKLTLLYGPSGVGKSSVLDAGVVHQLRRESLDETNGSPAHIVVSFRNWRDEPLAALERTIEGATTVKAPGATFADRLDGVTEQIDGDLLLILDQFEEYFMYHPGEEAETSFAAEFSRAVNRQNLRVSFLLSMREDSIAKLDFFKGRIPNLFDNYLRIDRLRRQQAEEAIVRPLEQFNRMFGATEGEYTIEPALVAAVLDQVRANRLGQDEAGRGGVSDKDDPGIETPHLQLVMTRLWREERQAGSHVLRLATLQRLGGPGEIVKRHVDAALDALTVDERDAAARIFQYLVTPAGTKIALGVEDLAPNADLSPADLRALLVKLSAGDRRILTPVAPAPDQPTRERYQIFHDVLAEKVLGWRRRYVAAAEQRAAERVAQEERLKAEREARAAAKLRRLLVVVVALLAVSIAAGWIAWQQNRTASSERRRADLARRAVDLATSAASENEARARESEARFQA
ncbi:MAG TPA: ATP-binding protein, partial [Vicinamibacterales bacterium]|nr:ATP-binding protein [Vicinamibacterales bacterium]